jgi:hypothetical protein
MADLCASPTDAFLPVFTNGHARVGADVERLLRHHVGLRSLLMRTFAWSRWQNTAKIIQPFLLANHQPLWKFFSNKRISY